MGEVTVGPETGGASTGELAWIRVDEPSTCASVRRRAADIARQVGLSDERVGEVSIVASELSSNLVKHARDGWVLLRLLRHDRRSGVGVLTLDSGPGARDIVALTEDGQTTTGTLGIGLGAVKRLADRLDLHSVPGVGTIASAEFWLSDAEQSRRVSDGAAGRADRSAVASSSAPLPYPSETGSFPGSDSPDRFAGITRPSPGELVCGDAYAQRRVEDGHLVMLVDGLGHGAMAARAADAAVRGFLNSRSSTPAAILSELHPALRHTRGAAVAVAHLDDGGRLTYAGVGNISGRVVDATGSSHLPSQPGIVGHNAPGVREVPATLGRGQWLVMHSDGLTDRWTLDDLTGILATSPVVLCAALVRAAGRGRDDAGVLALRV